VHLRVTPIKPHELGLAGVALVASVVAVLLTSSSKASAPAAAPAPNVLVLQADDLPAGFTLEQGATVSNAQAKAKKGSVAKDYTRLGRISGYDATYTREVASGLFEVESSISVYKTSAGAAESLSLSYDAADANTGGSFKRLTLSTSLGSDPRLYLTRIDQQGTKLDVYTVLWRHDAVYATLAGVGLAGTVDPARVVALAAEQEARISEAL
jgi:hypothetical protein